MSATHGILSIGPQTRVLQAHIRDWIACSGLPLTVSACDQLKDAKPTSFQAALIDFGGLESGAVTPVQVARLSCPVAACMRTLDVLCAGWVPSIVGGQLQVLVCHSDGASAYAPAISWLERTFLGDWTSSVIAELIAENPKLEPLIPIICCVLSDPWSIRRPRDLLTRSALTRQAIRTQCSSAGFGRAEHLILFVRRFAYDYLRHRLFLPRRRAQLMSGIRDTSNFRRQVTRLGQ